MRYFLVMLLGLGTLQAQAQSVETLGRQEIRIAAVQEKQADAKSDVTVNFVNTSLASAVESISAQGKISVWFSPQLLSGYIVTYRANGVNPESALEAVLAKTPFQVRRSADGSLKIVADPAKPGKAAAQGIVVGKVIHAKTKQPVMGATVLVDNTEKGVTTGSDGTFRISAETGERTVHVRAMGFMRQARRITVRVDETVAVDIALEPSASVLDEVVVTGTVVATERKAITTPITVITAEEIEQRGITRIDQFFRGEVPGVIAMERGTRSYFGGYFGGVPEHGQFVKSEVYARGSANLDGSANPLKTFIDGVEIVDAAYLGSIDIRSIERIEIIVGPQAATIYGPSARGGVMQIFTKNGSGTRVPEMTLLLKYGMLESSLSSGRTPSHNHGLQLSGGLGPAFSYSGNVSYSYLGQWQPKLFARSRGVSAGVSHTSGPFDIRGSISLTHVTNGTIEDPPTYRTRRANGDWDWNFIQQPGYFVQQRVASSESQALAFNADYRMLPRWNHHLVVGRNQVAFQTRPMQPRFSNVSDTLYRSGSRESNLNTASYNTTVSSSQWSGFQGTMVVGANGTWGRGSSMWGCTVTEKATQLLSCSPNPTNFYAGNDLPRRTWGGFGSWRLGIHDRLYLTSGLRAERSPTSGEKYPVDWTPTHGFSYAMELGGVSLKLLGSYGRSMKAPSDGYRNVEYNTDPDYFPLGFITRFENLELRPEYARGPQGGFELYFGNRASLTVNTFQQTVTDLIQQVVVDSIEILIMPDEWEWTLPQTQFQNTAKIRQFGWEGTASLTLGPVSMRGSYSWTDNRLVKLNSNAYGYWQTEGQMFEGVPSHSAFMSIGYARGATSISLNSNYIGASLQAGGLSSLWLNARYLRIKTYIDNRVTSIGMISRPGYLKSDLAISHRISQWASATVNVTNLGNRFASDVSDLNPSLGRQTLIGVSLRRAGQ